MTEALDSISTLIDRWPSIADFANDVGCSYEAARQMRRRNSMPSAYWLRAVEAAKARAIADVSLEALAAHAAKDLEAAE
jgi:hypothetical protein